MADPTPSHVQLPSDGSGKKIRNLQSSVVEDADVATVYTQVVALADDNAKLLPSPLDWQEAVLERLDRQNELLEALIEALT